MVTIAAVGVLSTLVTVAVLVPLPPVVSLSVVGGLVVAVTALGLLAVRRWRRTGATVSRRGTFALQALWFWGVVTGVTHLLRSFLAEPSGVGTAVSGAFVAACWSVVTWFVGPGAPRRPKAGRTRRSGRV